MFLSEQVSSLDLDGSLVVDLRRQDGPLVRFGPFAQGMPRYRMTDGGRVETAFDCGARLVNRAHDARKDLPVQRYLEGWSRQVVDALFPVWHAQSAVMQLCAMHPSASDLLRANPVLLWLLAERCVETAGWREQSAELLRLPQRALLARVLDRTAADVRPAQVRFLRKLVVIEGSQQMLHQVRQIAADEQAVMALRHWQRLPTPLLALARGPLLLHLHWLREELAATGNRWMLGQIIERHGSLIRDTSRMLHQPGHEYTDAALNRFARTPGGLARLHDILVRALNDPDAEVHGSIANAALSFGAPPTSSNDVFQAITTVGELYDEGRQMRHCVATRAADILAGTCYVYRVDLNGERGTLQVGVRPDGLVIDEFRLRNNAEPSPATWKAAAEWIHRAGSCEAS